MGNWPSADIVQAANRWIDRGDPSDYDFETGDLTADGAWHDLDLSGIVPAGATFVYLEVGVEDGTAGNYLQFRKNGNSGTIAPQTCRVIDTSTTNNYYITVPCDSDRVVEYKASNTVFTALNVTVLAWYIDDNPDAVLLNVPHWVDRGDPSDYDFDVSDFTNDGAWHDLDLSSIVPAGATMVKFRVSIQSGTAGDYVQFRKNGLTNEYISATFRVQNSQTMDFYGEVSIDASRVIEYKTANSTFTKMDFVVAGWYIDDDTDLLGASHWVDRGDPSDYDFEAGDLTTDDTWNDLDLSSIVPEWATRVKMFVQINSSSAAGRIHFRKNGNSNDYSQDGIRGAVTGVTADGVVDVACDTSRVIEYKAENVTWSYIRITVVAWYIDENEDSILLDAPHWVDRGDLSTYDFSAGDLTKDGSWYDLDLSSIVPAGATFVRIWLRIKNSGTLGVSFRKNGSSMALPVNNVASQVSGVDNYGGVVVPCDSNRVIEYMADSGTWTTLNVYVLAWYIDTVN